ncbi:hypothetical protein NDU88_004265 [Pleurodeles waltl]|uniref:Uncharacterized protein n=1 Tax=Pleurodeles waltl TaxID=8319 RepID=A0AAV7QFM1_PLEWA|nr:hypothetical protein NDU88_004265 [Pleurodeles waltl]
MEWTQANMPVPRPEVGSPPRLHENRRTLAPYRDAKLGACPDRMGTDSHRTQSQEPTPLALKLPGKNHSLVQPHGSRLRCAESTYLR